MNSYKVLFLTDKCDGTASRSANRRLCTGTSVITLTYRQTIASYAAADFDLIIVEAEEDTMQDILASCRHLRSATEIPILFVSPLDDEEVALAAYKAGVDDYILKPFSRDLLFAKMRAWLRWTMPTFHHPMLLPAQQMLSAM
jgi:DNA-binding response OmpR family regulator